MQPKKKSLSSIFFGKLFVKCWLISNNIVIMYSKLHCFFYFNKKKKINTSSSFFFFFFFFSFFSNFPIFFPFFLFSLGRIFSIFLEKKAHNLDKTNYSHSLFYLNNFSIWIWEEKYGQLGEKLNPTPFSFYLFVFPLHPKIWKSYFPVPFCFSNFHVLLFHLNQTSHKVLWVLWCYCWLGRVFQKSFLWIDLNIFVNGFFVSIWMLLKCREWIILYYFHFFREM